MTDEDIKLVFEKDRAFSIVKTVQLQTIDDTKSDVSFGSSSLIESSPVKFNNILETPETVEVKIIKENITIRILETPEKVKTNIEDKKITSSLETLQEVKPDIKEEKVTKLLKKLEEFKRDIKEEEDILKPLETLGKVKSDIKDEKVTNSREALQKVKPEIEEENIINPIKTDRKIETEIKAEKITKFIDTLKKVKSEIKEKKITKPPEAQQKVKIDVKENINKNVKTGNDLKKTILEVENPTVSANKRKKLNCDEQVNVLREVKPENIKVEQKLNYKSHSNFVINPKNKKFKNDIKVNEKLDMEADTSSTRNNLDDSSTSSSENTSSQSRSVKKQLNIMFTGVNYQEYEKPLSEIGKKLFI